MFAVYFTVLAGALVVSAQALQCLPSRSCPSTETQKYMCVGYTDVSGATRLLCDGVHTKISACRDYYRYEKQVIATLVLVARISSPVTKVQE